MRVLQSPASEAGGTATSASDAFALLIAQTEKCRRPFQDPG